MRMAGASDPLPRHVCQVPTSASLRVRGSGRSDGGRQGRSGLPDRSAAEVLSHPVRFDRPPPCDLRLPGRRVRRRPGPAPRQGGRFACNGPREPASTDRPYREKETNDGRSCKDPKREIRLDPCPAERLLRWQGGGAEPVSGCDQGLRAHRTRPGRFRMLLRPWLISGAGRGGDRFRRPGADRNALEPKDDDEARHLTCRERRRLAPHRARQDAAGRLRRGGLRLARRGPRRRRGHTDDPPHAAQGRSRPAKARERAAANQPRSTGVCAERPLPQRQRTDY